MGGDGSRFPARHCLGSYECGAVVNFYGVTMSDGKIALLAFGVLIAGSVVWCALIWWLGRDADKILDAYRKTYRGPKS